MEIDSRAVTGRKMDSPSWTEGSEFVRAIAELLRAVQWPLVTLIIAFFFRADIKKLLSRVRRGSIFGAEVELEQALDLLEEGADKAEQQQMREMELEQPEGATPLEEDLDAARLETEMAKERDILRTASVSPRAALMLLSSEIETTLRRLAESAAIEDRMPHDARFQTVREIAGDLAHADTITERTEENIDNLWRVRALVVHEGQGEDDDVLRAIDSGLTILRTLNRLETADAADVRANSVGNQPA